MIEWHTTSYTALWIACFAFKHKCTRTVEQGTPYKAICLLKVVWIAQNDVQMHQQEQILHLFGKTAIYYILLLWDTLE